MKPPWLAWAARHTEQRTERAVQHPALLLYAQGYMTRIRGEIHMRTRRDRWISSRNCAILASRHGYDSSPAS
jgi:hypothetical protein